MYTVMATLIVSLLLLGVSTADNKFPREIAVPKNNQEAGESETHHLVKRQTTCPFFFLREPPTSLQCNPQQDRTLTLTCKFLVGDNQNRIPLGFGWFFSLDGSTADLVQVSRFESNRSFSAFENVLVVLNALPGAYFCSVSIQGDILDSNVLRVNAQTLRTVCQSQQPPTAQPPVPRCAQRGIPINTNLVAATKTTVVNTINFQMGVVFPTPTYTIGFERTVILPSVTPTPTYIAVSSSGMPVAAPQERNNLGIGIGVGMALAFLLMVLVTAIIVGVVCFIKKRERNQLKFGSGFNEETVNPNTEPLLSSPPPDKPPPLLSEQAVSNPTESQHEQIEMNQIAYAVPSNRPIPLPYEKVSRTLPRYSNVPGAETSTEGLQSQPVPEEPQTRTDTHYSPPKFPKNDGRSSTSREISTESSSPYVLPQHLEPFQPPQGHAIKASELMLGGIDENAEYTTSESPSESEEGSYTDRSGGDDNRDKPRAQEGKSPSTGQITGTYVNTKRYFQESEGGIEEGEREKVGYVNTQHLVGNQTPRSTGAALTSAKSVPGKAKKRKKIRKVKSVPMTKRASQVVEDEYTSLVQDTFNYTSVYTATKHPKVQASDKDGYAFV